MATVSGADVYTCVVEADGTFTPGLASVTTAASSLLAGKLPPALGSFALAPAAGPPQPTCVDAHENVLQPQAPVIVSPSVSGSGSYEDTYVCGDLTMSGTLSLSGATTLNAVFSVVFTDGNGAMVITNATNGGSGTGNGTGWASIVPSSPTAGTCVTQDVQRFTFDAAFTVTVPIGS